VSKVVHEFRSRGLSIYTRFSQKSAKKLVLAILGAKDEEERKDLYAARIEKAKPVIYQRRLFLEAEKKTGTEIKGTFGTLPELFDKLEKIVSQTERRVIFEERVPTSEKIVSVFESHCDIIVKDRRETQFGHKVMVTTGPSRLILDFEVLAGNPADAEVFENSLERLTGVTGRVPTQVAADGGFSSIENVEHAKGLGVKDVAFSKYRGLEILDMCKTVGVFKALRNFRAGIEGDISNLKRGFDIFKCVWKGLYGFVKQAWSRVCAYNLALLHTS
jgi:IS5 family transposase